jgi:hypothetical protein
VIDTGVGPVVEAMTDLLQEEREAGENPALPRNCERGRKPPEVIDHSSAEDVVGIGTSLRRMSWEGGGE